nr:hypothetical protein [Maliibacterium massiliense]
MSKEMASYFDQDGHLTEAAFDALIAGGADELARLEMAEHMDFCDACMIRYTERVLQDELMPPAQSVAPVVMAHIRRDARRQMFRRLATVAVAAALALTFWFTGAFDMQRNPKQGQALIQGANQAAAAITQGANSISGGLSGALQWLFQSKEGKQ